MFGCRPESRVGSFVDPQLTRLEPDKAIDLLVVGMIFTMLGDRGTTYFVWISMLISMYNTAIMEKPDPARGSDLNEHMLLRV